MKITDVRLHQVTGTLPFEGVFWEERLIQPIDVYPEYRDRQRKEMRSTDDRGVPISSIFIEIETDEGVTGIGGPITLDVAFIAWRQFRELPDRATTRSPPSGCGTSCTARRPRPQGRGDVRDQRDRLRAVGPARQVGQTPRSTACSAGRPARKSRPTPAPSATRSSRRRRSRRRRSSPTRATRPRSGSCATVLPTAARASARTWS